jgi:hypothetical protein
MTRIAVVLLVTLLSVAGPPATARAADRLWHRYGAICEKLHLDALHRTPLAERDRLEVLLRLAPGSGAPPGTRPPTLTIDAKGGPIRLEPGPEGVIDFPVTDALLAEDPPVLTTAPEGQKTGVSFELRPVRPAGTSFPLAELMASVSQANKLIKAQAGFLSFAIPTMKAVRLVYPAGAPQTARLTAPGVERTIDTDAQGNLRIPRDEALEAAGARVELSSPPLRFELAE